MLPQKPSKKYQSQHSPRNINALHEQALSGLFATTQRSQDPIIPDPRKRERTRASFITARTSLSLRPLARRACIELERFCFRSRRDPSQDDERPAKRRLSIAHAAIMWSVFEKLRVGRKGWIERTVKSFRKMNYKHVN